MVWCLLAKWILCSLRFTRKAKCSIYKRIDNESEDERNRTGRGRKVKHSWYPFEAQVQTFQTLVFVIHRALVGLSLMLVLLVLTLSIISIHTTFTLPASIHIFLVLLQHYKYQSSNAPWMVWFSKSNAPSRHHSLTAVCLLRTVSRQPSETDRYWSNDCDELCIKGA